MARAHTIFSSSCLTRKILKAEVSQVLSLHLFKPYSIRRKQMMLLDPNQLLYCNSPASPDEKSQLGASFDKNVKISHDTRSETLSEFVAPSLWRHNVAPHGFGPSHAAPQTRRHTLKACLGPEVRLSRASQSMDTRPYVSPPHVEAAGSRTFSTVSSPRLSAKQKNRL